MTLTLAPSYRPNSSSTPPAGHGRFVGSNRRSEGFSALMRPKQEPSRVEAGSLTGGPLRALTGLASEVVSSDGKPIGPRGDPAPIPSEREEFQRYGHEPSSEPASSEALSLWVDPLQRVLAHATAPPESVAPHVTHPALAMDELWKAVRRIAWGGDRHRSVAYIELGAGELKGASLTLEARGSAISLVLDLPAGASSAGWAQRLADRLARRGLEVQSVEVR